MNEQRIQAYRNLIQQLLTCPSNGEAKQILNQSKELVDEGFVQMCQLRAQELQQAGKKNQAGFLRKLAQQVAAFPNPQPSGGERKSREPPANAIAEDYFNFLIEVLKATENSQGNPSVVYPLLQQNLDKLDLKLAHLLQILANQTLNQVEENQAARMAAVIGNFATLIQQFSWGSQANNLEIAIVGYEISLTVFTRDAFPEDWALTQNNLGAAYRDRIQGKRGQNLELAIACYQAALQVYTPDAFPEDWAGTQNNLGIAYNKRIQGERDQNREWAIASFQAALQVYTREAYPEKWGMTQVNLADTLLDLFEYSRQDPELNQAIAIYREVLDSYPQLSLTLDRASILYKLGKALSRQGSYSQAIQSLEEACTLLKGPLHLQLLALTFFELGRLYHRTHRLEKARLYFKDTLRLFRRLGEQDSIADVMTELGNLELQLGQIQSARAHLEEAREYYQGKGNQERIEQIEWLLSLLGEPREAIARG
jgi:tetratricopeptide (TPR) repeat protein